MIKEIKDARNEYMKLNGFLPDGVSLDYFSGVDLLLESMKLKQSFNKETVIDLLDEGNRKKIIKFIESTKIFNMTISIPDIIGDRRIVCTTQQ